MHQQPLRRTDDDGSTLLESIDTFSAEIQDKIAKSCSKIEMKSELLDQSLDTIKSSFDDLHTVLNKREDALIDDLKAASEESVKSQETFVKDAETLAESVDKLQDEIKKSVPISDQIAVNAYRRRLETMSGQFKGMLGKVFEPVFARDTSERIIEGLRVGQIKTEVSYKPAEDASATNGENWAMLKPDLKITDSDTFSLHRPDVDQKESIITSIVWKNGRILATDKSNRKLKIFTEEGQFLFEILFSNAEPYCVASIDSVIDRDDAVDKFAVTFPKAKYLYFVCYESKVKNKQPSIWFYFKTEVGYSGVSPGSRTNQLLCTVVSNSGDPRIDILDFQGHILQTFSVDSADRYLFSFPRYILTNANNIIVSDHKKNEVIFLDCNGVFLGRYMGVHGHPLVNPFDITFDGEGNIYVLDGKTGHIQAFDTQFRTISVIRCGSKLLNPRLLEYDIPTNRLAITHAAGKVTIYPVTPKYTIEEFETEESTGHGSSGNLAPGDSSPSTMRRSLAGSEGLLMAPQDTSGRASPGF